MSLTNVAARTIPDVAGLSTQEAAKTYIAAGFYIFPLKPGTKEPFDGFDWDADYFTATEEVEDWAEECGIGLPLAINGLVGIDVDHPENAPDDLVSVLAIFATANQTTRLDGSRTHHIYDAAGEAFSQSTKGFPAQGWGEVKSLGYIVVEPTPHKETGGAYKWQARTIMPLPNELRGWLKPAGESAPEADSEAVQAFLDTWTKADRPRKLTEALDRFRVRVEAGESRNNVLTEVAGDVFRDAVAGCFPAREAYDALLDAVGPYEPGRAEGVLGRVISKVIADDPEELSWRNPPKLTALDPEKVAKVTGARKLTDWDPQSLDDVLAGDYEPDKTAVLARVDGICLLYAGKTHSFSGESESGKSWLALLAAYEVLAAGGRVLFLDFESDRYTVVTRLLLLGAQKNDLRERLDYVHPDGDPMDRDETRAAFERLLAKGYQLAVIDGVTEAMTSFALTGRDERDVATFQQALSNKIARTGAAVVSIDHVVKSKDDRGRFSLGSQHKLAGLTGAAYIVEAKEPIRPGHVGVIDVRVAKDRPGWVRQHSGKHRAGDNTQPVTLVTLDSRDSERTTYKVAMPEGLHADGTEEEWRPKVLMQRVSEYLDLHPDASRRSVGKEVTGKETDVLQALDFLVKDGYVELDSSGRWPTHRNLKPYRAGRLTKLTVVKGAGLLSPISPSIDGGNEGDTKDDSVAQDIGRQ
jgi:hypothetical protein